MIRKNWKTSLIWFIIRVLEVSYIFMLCVPTVSFSEEDRVLLSIENRLLSSEDRVLSSEYRALSSEYTTPSSEVRVLWSQDSVLSNEFRVLSRFVYYIILYLQSFSGKKEENAFLFSVKYFNINRLVDRSFLAILAKYLTQKNICLLFFEKILCLVWLPGFRWSYRPIARFLECFLLIYKSFCWFPSIYLIEKYPRSENRQGQQGQSILK